jgi:hypothetical protein
MPILTPHTLQDDLSWRHVTRRGCTLCPPSPRCLCGYRRRDEESTYRQYVASERGTLAMHNTPPTEFKPRNAARRCQLTPALLLRGFSIGFGDILARGLQYPRVLAKPTPAPVETCTLGHGYWFSGAQVRANTLFPTKSIFLSSHNSCTLHRMPVKWRPYETCILGMWK